MGVFDLHLSASGGEATPIQYIDLGVLGDETSVYGVGFSQTVYLGYLDDDVAGVGGVYGVQYIETGLESGIANLGEIAESDLLFGLQFLVIPERSYRRIQLEGGGRQLFECVIGDQPVRRFFELHKNGRRFPLANVSNPIFSWRSPTGVVGEAVATIVDAIKGRVSVHLFEPDEPGLWLIQVRYVDELNIDGAGAPDSEAPYAPPEGSQEFSRQLPRALKAIVRNEGGWS